MMRNLKVLGLALVAVFAMSAMMASAASAQTRGHLTSANGNPVTLDIVEEEGFLSSFGGKTECTGTTYTGHKINETPHQPIPNGATDVTVTPHYGKVCTASGSLGTFPATIVTTGCDFNFHIQPTTGGGETYGVTADVVCPVGVAGIHVEVYSNAGHTERICTLTVGPQNGLTGGHLTNKGGAPATGEVSGTFTGIHVVRSGICLLDGGGTTTTGGTFNIKGKISGTDAEEEPVGISVSD